MGCSTYLVEFGYNLWHRNACMPQSHSGNFCLAWHDLTSSHKPLQLCVSSNENSNLSLSLFRLNPQIRESHSNDTQLERHDNVSPHHLALPIPLCVSSYLDHSISAHLSYVYTSHFSSCIFGGMQRRKKTTDLFFMFPSSQ